MNCPFSFSPPLISVREYKEYLHQMLVPHPNWLEHQLLSKNRSLLLLGVFLYNSLNPIACSCCHHKLNEAKIRKVQPN